MFFFLKRQIQTQLLNLQTPEVFSHYNHNHYKMNLLIVKVGSKVKKDCNIKLYLFAVTFADPLYQKIHFVMIMVIV